MDLAGQGVDLMTFKKARFGKHKTHDIHDSSMGLEYLPT